MPSGSDVISALSAEMVLSVACMLLGGCDALITRWQTADVHLSDLYSGESVEGATLAFAIEKAETSHWRGREQEWLDRVGQQAYTGSDGLASVDLKIQILRAGLFPGIIPGPDLSVDRVTGKRYLARIRCDGSEETLRVRMNCGDHSDGERYRLTILRIGKPRRNR